MVDRYLGGALVSGLIAIASCQIPSAATTCHNNDECPTGFRCDDLGRYCTADARATDASSALAPCGTVQCYQNTFDDNVAVDWWPWSDNVSMTASATSGHLEINFAVNGTASSWAGFTTILWTDLRGSALSIQLADPVEFNASATSAMRYYFDADNRAGFVQEPGNLTVTFIEDGVDQSLSLGSFDRSAESWWRLREADGFLYFDTSGDGETWLPRHHVVTPWFVDGGKIDLMAGAWQDGMVPDRVVFDNLNQHAPRAPWCPVSSLADDFSDGTSADRWVALDGTGCSAVESWTALHVHAPDISGTECGLESQRVFALDASGVTIHIASAPLQPGVFAGIILKRNELGLWWEWGMEDGTLTAYGEKDYRPVFEPPAAPGGERRWLRLRQSGGVLFFDARGDAPTDAWETIYNTPPPLSFDTIFVGIEVGVWDTSGTTTSSHDAVFDHFNLPP